MKTIGYCRVSTEEQAAEGYSLERQAAKTRAFAQLREVGPVEMIEHPGRSGKGSGGGGSSFVSEGGFEPPRAMRPLGPQPSAST